MTWFRALVLWIQTEIGIEEAALTLALALMAAGFWSWWRPGAYLVPAIVLLWMFLPTRHRFVVRAEDPTKGKH